MIELGPPLLWITLSPAVVHSPIFLRIAGIEFDMSQIPSHSERAIMVANDPVAAAIYFNTVIDGFTDHILGYKKEKGGVFGHVSAYYGMIEEQGTGTLHNHMLVWLHGFKLSEFRSQIEDETYKADLIKYLDHIIKQGYLDTDNGTDNPDQDLNVSEVSFKDPVKYDDPEFNDDVNKLVTVANTHKCRATCHNYGHTNDCRFEYPRELVEESTFEDNQLMLKRTSEWINNYNPVTIECTRSNMDIKPVITGKDGKNIAFYITNYATKSQLSSHNMIPLIALSRKRLDLDTVIASSNIILRAKAMMTKCLNKITTETEISASHVSHFLLRKLDNKTSHTFTALNLHAALGWLFNAIKEYDDIDEALTENIDDNPDNTSVDNDSDDDDNDDDDNDDDNDNDDSSDDDDDDDDDNGEVSHTVSTGNEGLCFTNQMIDYLNRGDTLKHMCLWDYCAKVYKCKLSKEDLKKFDESKKHPERETSNQTFKMHKYFKDHPQSETHGQRERIKGSFPIPTLTKLPPSSKEDRLKFQKCMLLLFKPYTNFEELYNGISWNETYLQFLEITDKKEYIDNIEELHKGIEGKDENDENDDVIDEIEDDDCQEDPNQSDHDDDDDTGLDSETVEAIKVIESTPWLDESISNRQNEHDLLAANGSNLPSFKTWEKDMNRQNQDILDNPENENNDDSAPVEHMANSNERTNVTFSMEIASPAEIAQERDRVQRLREEICDEYTLNKKQKKAYEIATENVIKRHFNDETEQLKGYVGGPGGTGKSQLIKAIVAFHKRMNVKHTLKLSAVTGTASKHIGGSTTCTMFGGFESDSITQKDKTKLQTRFKNVETIIIDEVSMVGCRHLAKISTALTTGKCVAPEIPFGGVDIIFFGDFIQFSPIKDTPLYAAWQKNPKISKSKRSEERKQLGMHLWRQVDKIVLLDEQMRCTDQRYLDLLSRLREGKCTDDDIALLNTRVIGQHVDVTSIVDTPIITPGNQLVMAINDRLYISTADDYTGRKKERKQLKKKVLRKLMKKAATSTEGLPRELQLYVGMPVMVTRNIHTELGVTNGTRGWIRSIHFKRGQVISGTDSGLHHISHQPEYIIVELEDINVEPLQGLPPNHIPIFPQRRSISVSMGGKQKKVSVNRCHFPLVPVFACTAHKSQGQTLSKAVVNLQPRDGKTKGLAVEFAYVPLSRVKRLVDLTILKPFPLAVLKAEVNEGCAAMMEEFKVRDLCKDL